MDSLRSYKVLVRRVDNFVEGVLREYPSQICCTIGCSRCCESSFGVFPVEAWAVRDWLEKKGKRERKAIVDQIRFESTSTCPALVDRKCVIYPARPILCRTQGLPILERNERGTLELSFCTENFKAQGVQMIIRGEFILDLEKVNASLAALDQWFRSEWMSVGRGQLPLRVRVIHFLEGLASRRGK